MSPSVPVSIAWLPELCFKWHKHSFWDAYTFNPVMSIRNGLFQTHSPDIKWARKEIATNHNNSYTRKLQLSPDFEALPSPQATLTTDTLAVFMMWKAVQNFDAITIGKLNLHENSEYAYFISSHFISLSWQHGGQESITNRASSAWVTPLSHGCPGLGGDLQALFAGPESPGPKHSQWVHLPPWWSRK